MSETLLQPNHLYTAYWSAEILQPNHLYTAYWSAEILLNKSKNVPKANFDCASIITYAMRSVKSFFIKYTKCLRTKIEQSANLRCFTWTVRLSLYCFHNATPLNLQEFHLQNIRCPTLLYELRQSLLMQHY